MKKEEFSVLLDKYLSGKTNLEENKLLLNFFESFQTSNDWNEALGSKDEVENKMLTRLQDAVKSDEVQIIHFQPLYKRTIFRIALAASVVVLFSLSVVFNTKEVKNVNTPIVVKNNIMIGKDKAILTLEDGSVIALEKGKAYTTKNVKSNGEKLVYNSTDNVKTEIANNFLTIPRGGQFYVQLADGTRVWLNSESQLKYPIAFVDGETRQVELLYGEAYFEVSPSTAHKGSRFKVKTRMQNIEVIGTEFNIKAYKDEPSIYTTLVEGKVQVSNASTKSILAPSQQSKLSNNTNRIEIYDVDTYNEVSWRKGLFVFKGMPLKNIAKVLSRWYDVDIEFANPEQSAVKFNGVLNKNQNLEEILTTIKTTKFINAYEIKNKKIIIK